MRACSGKVCSCFTLTKLYIFKCQTLHFCFMLYDIGLKTLTRSCTRTDGSKWPCEALAWWWRSLGLWNTNPLPAHSSTGSSVSPRRCKLIAYPKIYSCVLPACHTVRHTNITNVVSFPNALNSNQYLFQTVTYCISQMESNLLHHSLLPHTVLVRV